ncbi:MAG: hypothetical protein HYT11_00395 [Candidatus Levybacteria bacterium]|nr:hypothetical protein [Candidatus Levybacteria bacterium]
MDKGKKGIYLTNRFWESKVAERAHRAFFWWRGGRLNKTTLILMCFVASANVFLAYPLFRKDVTSAYNSSAFVAVSELLSELGIVHTSLFFSIVTAIAISFAPISMYLFVRKIVLRHELTALLATLLYILPNPLSPHFFPLVGAVLNGDGAHAFVFAFVPLFLLYVQAFLSTGVVIWGIFAILGTAIIAILSPFVMFNLLIFYTILAVAEGFLGNFRVKFARLLLLLAFAFALSFFWYYPTIITQIFIMSHVKRTLIASWSVLPLAIPVLPVIGTVSFLVFDGREKLKPIFISSALLVAYLALYLVSKSIHTTGIFTPQRYTIELAFSLSFFLAVIGILLVEMVMRNYLSKIKNTGLFLLAIFFPSIIFGFFGLQLLYLGKLARDSIIKAQISNTFIPGIGNIERVFRIDIFFIGASFMSFIVFCVLVLALFRFPFAKYAGGKI